MFSVSLIAKGYYKTYNNRFKDKYSLNIRHGREIRKIKKSNYIELEGIGSTTLSQIYLIYHFKNEAFYAIKKRNEHKESSKLNERELMNYLLLDNPFLCKIYGVTEEKHLIIEYINGKTLNDIKISTIQEKINIIIQLIFALNYLHKNNFVYRDLKPNNIMIDINYNVVIIDFDRMIKNEGENDNEEHTKDFGNKFIAQELYSETIEISEQNDIFSLGQIIYYIMNDKKMPDENMMVYEDVFKNYLIVEKSYKKCIKENLNERPTLNEILIGFCFEPKIPIENILNEIFSKMYDDFNFSNYIDRNKIDSQHELHLLMESGKMKNINEKNVIELYSYIKNQSESVTLNDLGIMYLQNKYVKTDINKALHYLKLAADQNLAISNHNLGRFYYDDVYIQRDINKAIQYFSNAAEQNYADSQFYLGCIYFQGKYIQKDIEKAKYFLSQASKQNHLNALFFLGVTNMEYDFNEKTIKENIHYFENAANQGHSSSQFMLGFFYHKYINEPNSIEKAIYYYSLASKQNHIEANFNLGDVYIQGKYNEIDINKAIYYFTKAAEQNHKEAQFNLGVIYSEGKYVTRDINKAIYYYYMASNQNHSEAQFKLGFIYDEGKYVTKDINKAIYYYTLAANQNHSEAQFNLGLIYSEGKYVTKDINKAIYYYTLAANQNYYHAQTKLGYLYESRDIKKSLHYCEMGAKNNDPIAQYNMGLFYLTSKHVLKDMNLAIDYLKQSANQNFTQAQLLLGDIYLTDQYVKHNIELSMKYYSLAFNKSESPEAAYKLGCIYLEKGKQCKNDLQKAIEYFTFSANQNYMLAQYNLGFTYDTYFPNEINKAIKYYKLAAEQNYPAAQCNLGKIYATKYKPIDMKIAIHYYTLSANNNCAPALCNLGNIYLDGVHVTRDVKKAIGYYLSASEQNYSNAQFKLGLIYSDGKYVALNINKAMHYFSLAARNNNPLAQLCIGLIYYYIKKDIQKAIHYSLQAAYQSCEQAQSFLGYIYYTNSNVKKGVEYIMLASLNKDIIANFMLGFLYQEGKHIEKNIKEAINYYNFASSFNNQYAKNNLGIIYKHGYENIEGNTNRAVEYFKESIKQKNDFLSMYNLAHIYIYEKGMENIKEAIQLLINSIVFSIISSTPFYDSFFLLYVVIIKIKIRFNKKSFKEEIKHISGEGNAALESYEELFNNLYEVLYKLFCEYDQKNQQFIDYLYENYKNVDFVYDIGQKPIQFQQLNTINEDDIILKREKKNISKEFFEGFGIN